MSHSSDRTSRALAVGGAAVLALVGLFTGFLFSIITISLIDPVVSLPPESPERSAIALIAQGAGLVAVVGLYLERNGLPWSYLRVSRPSLRDVGFAVLATVVLFLALGLLSVIVEQLGLSTTEHSVSQSADENPAVLLPLIPLSILVTGPSEELLFRGVIQTRLRETFTTNNAVIIASAAFALVHVPAYAIGSSIGLSLLTTLAILFVLGGLLGAAYEYTGNLFVPIIAHGVFNAVIYGSNYVESAGLL